MLDGSTLSWILLQILAVMAVLAIVLGLIVYRLSARYRRLVQAYRKLKEIRRPGRARRAPIVAAEPEQVEDPLATASAESQERFQKVTGRKLVDYRSRDPFSARIASLRYQYLQAELAARDAQGEHGRWVWLEKTLSKLVSAIAEQNTKPPQKDPDRVSLLEQRMKALKGVEGDNAQLREQNRRYGRELKRLQGYYSQYRELVAQLDTPRIRPSPASVGRQGADRMAHAHDAQRQIVDDIHQHVAGQTHRDFYADKRPLMHQLDELKAGVEDYSQNLSRFQEQVVQEVGSDQKLGMINTLRDNNRSQRNTIIDLRRELNCLKRAMVDETAANDNEGNKGDKGDTGALERMVKECEDCIATLENEVDYLHEQIEQVSQQDGSAPSATGVVEQAGADDSQGESDPVTDMLLGFSLGIIETHSPEAVMQLVTDTLVQFNLAFAVRQAHDGDKPLFKNTIGGSEQPLRARLEALAGKDCQAMTSEGLEYGRDCLQVFVPAEHVAVLGEGRLRSVLDFMYGLVRLQLDHLHSLGELANQHRKVMTLAEKVRSGVTNIDIQYAYQTEETKRIVDNLIVEITQLVSVMDIDNNMQTIFDNAIKEAQQRFQLLYESGSAVDREISQLSESLGQMEKSKGQ